MKKNFKKFLAVLTVFVMALGVVALPNATAQAAESGTYKTCNTWWGGGSFMVGYAADNSTIQAVETEKGFWPEGGFPWWTAVVLEVQNDGNWVVKEIIPADGSNDKANVALKTGRLVVMYHGDIEKATDFDGVANKAFFDSLKVGDTLSALGMWDNEIAWETLPKGEDVAKFTKVAAQAPATPDNSGSDNAGSNNAGTNVPSTGDATPVVAMASMLLVAVACVALGLKKRNA